ncbi:MAG: hypothetical protein ACFFBD_13090 [Candidatus Hodarchaeota archaeon]
MVYCHKCGREIDGQTFKLPDYYGFSNVKKRFGITHNYCEDCYQLITEQRRIYRFPLWLIPIVILAIIVIISLNI